MLEAIGNAEEQTRHYAECIRTDPGQPTAHVRHQAVIHALDHLVRLYHRCQQQERLDAIAAVSDLKSSGDDLRTEISTILSSSDAADVERRLNRLRQHLREQRRQYRQDTIAMTSTGSAESTGSHQATTHEHTGRGR